MQEIVEAAVGGGWGQEHPKEIKLHDSELGGIWEVMGKPKPRPKAL